MVSKNNHRWHNQLGILELPVLLFMGFALVSTLFLSREISKKQTITQGRSFAACTVNGEAFNDFESCKNAIYPRCMAGASAQADPEGWRSGCPSGTENYCGPCKSSSSSNPPPSTGGSGGSGCKCDDVVDRGTACNGNKLYTCTCSQTTSNAGWDIGGAVDCALEGKQCTGSRGSAGCVASGSQNPSTNQPPSGGSQTTGRCPAGQWECNGNCASSNVQSIFNGTWCNGQAQWMKEAGCGGSGGAPMRSAGCGGATSQTPSTDNTSNLPPLGSGGSGNCSYAKNGEYACRTSTECVKCENGTTKRDQPRDLCPKTQGCYQPPTQFTGCTYANLGYVVQTCARDKYRCQATELSQYSDDKYICCKGAGGCEEKSSAGGSTIACNNNNECDFGEDPYKCDDCAVAPPSQSGTGAGGNTGVGTTSSSGSKSPITSIDQVGFVTSAQDPNCSSKNLEACTYYTRYSDIKAAEWTSACSRRVSNYCQSVTSQKEGPKSPITGVEQVPFTASPSDSESRCRGMFIAECESYLKYKEIKSRETLWKAWCQAEADKRCKKTETGGGSSGDTPITTNLCRGHVLGENWIEDNACWTCRRDNFLTVVRNDRAIPWITGHQVSVDASGKTTFPHCVSLDEYNANPNYKNPPTSSSNPLQSVGAGVVTGAVGSAVGGVTGAVSAAVGSAVGGITGIITTFFGIFQ